MSKDKVQTIKDLAQLAGVSKSTVSRALSDNPLISKETRERICQLAAEHGFYRDNRAACLSRGESRVIGCTVSHCSGDSENGLPNTFQMELIYRLSASLREFQYDLMIINIEELDEDWPDQYFFGKRVDGFILLTLKGADQIIDRLLKIEAPFVIFGEKDPSKDYPCVSIDSFRGSYLMVKHLIDSGRKRIAYIRGPEYSRDAASREAGYRKAMEEAGLEIPCEPYPGLFDYNSGKKGAEEIINRGCDIDALAVSCDAAALGAIDYLKSEGINIPGDIAVTGFDNIAPAELHSPALTTVNQNMGDVAIKLLENLKEHIDHKKVVSTVLKPEPVIRKSG